VFIYGPGDVNGIMPRVTCAASYVVLNEPMRLLWDANMHINTVHVEDVARAIVHVATNDAVPAWSVFNLADKNDTTQGKLNALLENIFHISTGFLGTMLSNLAKIRLQDVVDTANEKHLQPWTEMLRQHAIHASPLTPYISSELLAHNQLFVNGEAIEATGFSYAHPILTEDALRESVYMAIEQRIFPPIVDGAPEPLPEPSEEA
jgi:nucleoside-diphosphate-sugar epimerase